MIDIPELCLDQILSNLSLDDLTSVADSNKAMNASAIRVFNLRFKSNFIVLATGHLDWLFWCSSDVDKKTKTNEIRNKMNIVPAVNHFGASMTAIRICINDSSLAIFFEKCSINLTKLYIHVNHCHLKLNQIFENVRELVLILHSCNIDESWTDSLSTFFPALQRFEIRNNMQEWEFRFQNTFINHIPTLNHFTYKGQVCETQEQLVKIGRFINANNQITTLDLSNSTHSLNKLLKFIEWDALAVERLNIKTHHRLDVGFLDKLQNLHTLKLHGFQYEAIEDMRLENLEEMDITLLDDPDDLVYPIIDFEFQCHHVKHFIIRFSEDLRNEKHVFDNIENIATDFPHLREITFVMGERAFGDNWVRLFREIKLIMDQCSSLKKINFKVQSKTMKIQEFEWRKFIPNEIQNWEMLIENESEVGSTYVHVSFSDRND